jgi:hypothetical protein
MSGLREAAAVLDALAGGHVPERASVLAGALALESLCTWGAPDRDLLDAAAGLNILVRGGALELNADGRKRAANLAEIVRGCERGSNAG